MTELLVHEQEYQKAGQCSGKIAEQRAFYGAEGIACADLKRTAWNRIHGKKCNGTYDKYRYNG